MMARRASGAGVATMESRSAAGSSTRPSRLSWFRARAILPSSQSDAAEAISRPTAHQSPAWLRGPRTSHRNTGTPAKRATLMAFGIVTTRACGSPAAMSPAATPALLPRCTPPGRFLPGGPPTLRGARLGGGVAGCLAAAFPRWWRARRGVSLVSGGILIGPAGLGVADTASIRLLSNVGLGFLLLLAG